MIIKLKFYTVSAEITIEEFLIKRKHIDCYIKEGAEQCKSFCAQYTGSPGRCSAPFGCVCLGLPSGKCNYFTISDYNKFAR